MDTVLCWAAPPMLPLPLLLVAAAAEGLDAVWPLAPASGRGMSKTLVVRPQESPAAATPGRQTGRSVSRLGVG